MLEHLYLLVMMGRLAGLQRLVNAVKVVLYAPQEIPKKLTARAAIYHLGDHYQAFLKANNITAWAPDDDYALREDKLADVLVWLGTAKGMTIAQIKYQAKKLIKLARSCDAKLKLSSSYDLVANCLGYKNFQTAWMCRSIDHHVDNLWSKCVLLSDGLLGSEQLENWPSSTVTDELRSRMQFNKKRSDMVNELKRRGSKGRTEREEEFLNLQRCGIRRRATAPIETRD